MQTVESMAKGHHFQKTVHGECSQENRGTCSTTPSGDVIGVLACRRCGMRMLVVMMSVVIVIPLHLVKDIVCVKGHLIEP